MARVLYNGTVAVGYLLCGIFFPMAAIERRLSMKRNWKCFMALTVAAVTAFQLAACGGGDTKGASNGAVQKDFVYVPEYQELEGVDWISGSCANDQGIYFSTATWDENTGESQTKLSFLDATSKEIKEIPLELLEEGQDSSADIQQMEVLSDGSIATIQSIYQVTDPETYDGKQYYMIRILSSEDGSILTEADITGDLGENTYVQYMAVDQADNIYLVDGDNGIKVFDKTGKKAFDMALPADTWIQAMGTSREGKVVYLTLDQATQGNVLNVIDPASRSVSKTCKTDVPDSWGNGRIVPGFEKGIILNGSNGLVAYDLEAEKATPVLDWLDSDINRDNVDTFAAMADGKIIALIRDYYSEQNSVEVAFLTKTPASEIQQKETITLGVMYSSQDTNRAVINFNKSNDEYRIQVIDYGSMGSADDYMDSLNRFNNDLTSGNGPDIFDLSNVNMKMLAQKGIIEDLNPYLDSDPELKRENYFESVLNAYSVDGKLYSIPDCFYVSTIIGKTADVGEEPGWTLDDLITLVESKPDDIEIFDYATREYILQMCLMFSFDEFVNWETGECNLDGEDFIKVLEFANRFESQDKYQYDQEGPSTPSKIQNGTLLLMSTSFSSVQDYQAQEVMFGEPITMIGYPTPSGTGNVLSGQNCYAINAKSKNKDAAWQFVRSFITPKRYEDGNLWGFPTLISAYDKVNEEYMTPEYYEDENGEQVEQSKGGWGWDDFSIDFYASTQEEVDAVTALINSCDRSYTYDMQLFDIITEEAAPFFEGQKTAQEVADIIQSRVKMYVSENR